MVKEAYVSIETANLLKNKQFDISCKQYYSKSGKLVHASTISNFNHLMYQQTKDIFNNVDTFTSAPTQQMVMMWLRELYNLYIEISFDSKDFFVADIYDMVKEDEYGCPYHYPPTIFNCKTYEIAAEAAIKQCLEKII